jgi:transcriptional regulator with XRE-family HTH domain
MFVAERGGRMPDSYGARLRQQREERGIALAAIAKQTRIKEALLEALEHDDLSQWPNGFYRRAFFRAYAAAIHLDPDAAFREFQALHPEPPEVDVMQAMAATLGRGEGNGRSTALRSAMGSAISSLSRLRRAAPEESAPAADAPLNGSLQLAAASDLFDFPFFKSRQHRSRSARAPRSAGRGASPRRSHSSFTRER